MNIILNTSGGFAGLSRTITINSADLPSTQQIHLEDLVKQVMDEVSLPAGEDGSPAIIDGHSYQLEVDGQKLLASDANLTDAQSELFDLLAKLNRK
jgi:Emfourin